MVTLLVIAAILFALDLLFAKRFGVPILAIAAGFLLSQYASPLVLSFSAHYLPEQAVQYIPLALIVIPSLLLLIFGKGRHRGVVARIINALLYAVIATVLIASSADASLFLDNGGYALVAPYQQPVIIAGLALAVLEATFGRASKKKLDEHSRK